MLAHVGLAHFDKNSGEFTSPGTRQDSTPVAQFAGTVRVRSKDYGDCVPVRCVRPGKVYFSTTRLIAPTTELETNRARLTSAVTFMLVPMPKTLCETNL